MNTFREIIDAFPTPEALAIDIGARAGTVRQWRNRNSIPGKVWGKIANAARERGIEEVTVKKLALIAERPAQKKVPAEQDEGRAA